MSISKTLIVTLTQDRAKTKEKFYIYKNDVGVDMYIELSNLTYRFDDKTNNFKYANALLKTPEELVFTIKYLTVENGKVIFSFTQDVIKNMQTIGKYEIQIQLFDSNLNRVTLPSITLEVKEPIGQTEVGIVDAVVGYSYVGNCFVANEINLFSIENGYIKTVWETGDLISATRLNNIEEGIENNRLDINILKNLLIQLPTYTYPTVTITSNIKSAELGSSISPTIKATYTKNDGGSVKSILIKDGSVGISDNYSITVPRFILKEDKNYTVEISYGDGEIKKDNFGNKCEDGQIKAGTISSSTTIKPYRGYFGFCSNSSEIPNGDTIRSNNIKGLDLKKGDNITVTTDKTSRLVCFAYPNSLGECKKIRYDNLNDDENKSAFNTMVLNVVDANGENPISYKVYYYISPIEFGMNSTFILTL